MPSNHALIRAHYRRLIEMARARKDTVTGSYVKAGQVFEKRRAWEFGRLVTTHVCVGMAQ